MMQGNATPVLWPKGPAFPPLSAAAAVPLKVAGEGAAELAAADWPGADAMLLCCAGDGEWPRVGRPNARGAEEVVPTGPGVVVKGGDNPSVCGVVGGRVAGVGIDSLRKAGVAAGVGAPKATGVRDAEPKGPETDGIAFSGGDRSPPAIVFDRSATRVDTAAAWSALSKPAKSERVLIDFTPDEKHIILYSVSWLSYREAIV